MQTAVAAAAASAAEKGAEATRWKRRCVAWGVRSRSLQVRRYPHCAMCERRVDSGMATAKQAHVTSPASGPCHARTLAVSWLFFFLSQVTCELKAAAAAARATKAEAEARAARETAARELTEARETAARELAEARKTRATTIRRVRIASLRKQES